MKAVLALALLTTGVSAFLRAPSAPINALSVSTDVGVRMLVGPHVQTPWVP
jgi:hypothetical protein